MPEEHLFQLDILTADKFFTSQSAQQVVFSSPSGRLGVLAGHMPMIAAVLEDPLEIRTEDGTWRVAAAGQGFTEITQEHVRFYLDTVEWADEIDVVRAKEALERASARLKGSLNHMEYVRTHAAIARAITRLKVAGK
ncbi:MAG: ATP synthase F1 subunit epsilon [Peptococcaceae bacterium]|nr:ATP synthase F1 subunit epsilon [Peptococcaceae bacterium]